MKKSIALFIILFGIKSSFAQIVINEYSCSNFSTVTDNFGQYEDWIELYNTTAAPINLSGYYLSDKATNPTQWQFTGGSIPANGTVIVWASKNNLTAGPNFHTNFALTQTKPEEIVLSNPAAVIIDQLTLNPAQPDDSRGRTTNGAATWSLFTTPTPNAANAGAQLDYVAKPVFSLAPGNYAGAQNVTITCATPNTQIYYTTSGADPNPAVTVGPNPPAPTLYSGPINISVTTLIKAIAISTVGTPSSFVETNTYFINLSTTLNVVSLGSYYCENMITTGSGAGNPWYTTYEYFTPSGSFLYEVDGETNPHGNDSWQYDQRGVDFVCNDRFGNSYTMDYPIFDPTITDRTKFDRVILKAAASDNYPFGPGNSCHIRDAFIHTLSQRADLETDERTNHSCIVYINGKYWGVYEIRERMSHAGYTDYYYNQDENNIDLMRFWGGGVVQYGTSAGWISLYNYIMANNLSVQANYDYVDSLLNINNFIDYTILNTYAVNSDWINWNTMWWHGKNPTGNKKKWRYVLWDEDNTWGLGQNFTGWPTTSWNADPCDLQGSYSNSGYWMASMDILNKLLANPDFEDMYINRYADLMNTCLSCAETVSLLDSMLAVIAPEMPNQIAQWGGSMAAYNTRVTNLHNFVNNRCAFIDSSLIGCYNLSGPYDITVSVSPPGSGDAMVSTLIPPSYPWTGTYFGGVNLKMKAIPKPGWYFDHWELLVNAPVPSTTSDTIKINLMSADNIVAYFVQDTTPGPPPPPEPVPPVPIVTVPLPDVFIPTAFSPNGDGKNDIFFIYDYYNNIASMDFKVYDRIGELVYHSTDKSRGWDGTFNGMQLNNQVLVYELKAKLYEGTEIIKSGDFTILK